MGTHPVGTTQVPKCPPSASLRVSHVIISPIRVTVRGDKAKDKDRLRLTAITITHRRLGQDEYTGLLTSIAARGNKDKAIMLGGKLMVLNTTDQVILIIMVMKVMGEVTKRTKNHHHVTNSSGQENSNPIMTSR